MHTYNDRPVASKCIHCCRVQRVKPRTIVPLKWLVSIPSPAVINIIIQLNNAFAPWNHWAFEMISKMNSSTWIPQPLSGGTENSLLLKFPQRLRDQSYEILGSSSVKEDNYEWIRKPRCYLLAGPKPDFTESHFAIWPLMENEWKIAEAGRATWPVFISLLARPTTDATVGATGNFVSSGFPVTLLHWLGQFASFNELYFICL